MTTPNPEKRRKGGRQLAPVDPKVVEGMASVGASNCDIADFVGVDESVIRDRFAGVLTSARASMRVKLRRTQLKVAFAGNPTMLIWLGKQMLGQADQSHVKVGELEQLSDDDLRLIADGKMPR